MWRFFALAIGISLLALFVPTADFETLRTVVLFLGLMTVAAVFGIDTNASQLRQRIADLEARISELER